MLGWNIDSSLSAICCVGWEYSVEATLGGYGPVEKAYHLCRRRRLVRLRQLVKPSQAKIDSEQKVLPCDICVLFNFQRSQKPSKTNIGIIIVTVCRRGKRPSLKAGNMRRCSR